MSYTMNRQKRKETPASTIIIGKKKTSEEWKKFSFRSAANDGIDCGDKQCYVEYRVIPDCYLILETKHINCTIPCVMDGCDKELHHFIPCPIWNCEPITTSTSSTTTSTTISSTTTSSTSTSSSTTTPRTPNGPSEMSPLIYTSIVLNILFFAILFAYLVVKCRIQITSTVANFRARRTLPTTIDPSTRTDPNPNEHFSVGSSDNESESGIDSNERQRLLPRAKPLTTHGSLETGQAQDNLALDLSDDLPTPSTSNWLSRAILGLDPLPPTNDLPLPSSSTNWQDVSLTSSPSPTSVENTSAATLNEVEVEPKKETLPKQTKPSEKPIFLLMKTFRKK